MAQESGDYVGSGEESGHNGTAEVAGCLEWDV
jgi:hypothetical protein